MRGKQYIIVQHRVYTATRKQTRRFPLALPWVCCRLPKHISFLRPSGKGANFHEDLHLPWLGETGLHEFQWWFNRNPTPACRRKRYGHSGLLRRCSAGFDDVAFETRIPSKVYFGHAIFATEPSVGAVSGCGVLIHECWLNWCTWPGILSRIGSDTGVGFTCHLPSLILLL